MNILFIGQRGIPAQHPQDSDEKRVEALAVRLAHTSHNVTVTCAKPYTNGTISRYHGTRLRHKFCMNPNIPGGFVHLFGCLLTMWRQQPDVVHMHGWKAALLVRLAALTSPETTFVWTISSLPPTKSLISRLVAWQAAGVFDVITAPTRQIQYHLLVDYRLRVMYVPDGYTQPLTGNISLKHFGLRTGQQFFITTATDPRDVRWIARAYRSARIRNKLVVPTTSITPAHTRIQKTYPFVQFVQTGSERAYASLLCQAKGVIVVDIAGSTTFLLRAMDSGKPIVSTTHPTNQEVLGTSAQFVKLGDVEGLTAALRNISTNKQPHTLWGKKAQTRARAHFTWQRILEEYKILYHYPVVRRVPIDSVRSASFEEKLA